MNKNKLNRWAAKNHILATAIMGIALDLVYIVALCALDAPIWAMVVLSVLLVLVCYAKVLSIRTKLVDDAAKELDTFCDPYPMLDEIDLQLTYRISNNYRQLLLINKSGALCSIGEYQAAYELLKSINVDAQALVQFKVLYYHNLSSVCTELCKDEEAEIWYEREMQLYDSMKEGKLKQSLALMAQISRVDHLSRIGEYAEALEDLKLIKPDTQRAAVSIALDCAKLCIKLDDTRTARERLQYVITSGKKLYAVTEARELLAKIQN